MRAALSAALLLLSATAAAKPWNGIDPGVSRRDEVIKKFGEPSKTVTQSDGKEVLAYFAKEAIRGTSQAQFKVDPRTQVVERIDVFPGPIVEKEAIETSYGPLCPPGAAPGGTCYIKKITDDFRTYFYYSKLGLAVFLNEDGKTVHSLIFQPAKAGK